MMFVESILVASITRLPFWTFLFQLQRIKIIGTLINNIKIKDMVVGHKYNKYIPEKKIAYNMELIVPFSSEVISFLNI